MAKKYSLYNYLKLESDYPAAITWMKGRDKIAKLFTSLSQAQGYLSRHRELIIEKGAKIVENYIPRPVYGVIIDWETGKPMIDTLTGEPNVCRALEKLNNAKLKVANITQAAKQLKETKRKASAMLDEYEDKTADHSLDLAYVRDFEIRLREMAAKVAKDRLHLEDLVRSEGHL